MTQDEIFWDDARMSVQHYSKDENSVTMGLVLEDGYWPTIPDLFQLAMGKQPINTWNWAPYGGTIRVIHDQFIEIKVYFR